MKDLKLLYIENPKKACQLALRRTRNLKKDRLEAINDLLGLFGVEAIRGEWQNGYWCDICAVYCNTGDTYDLTVIEVRGETSWQQSRFIVSSMGDFVEQNQKKLNIV